MNKKYIYRQFEQINRESNRGAIIAQGFIQPPPRISTSRDAEVYLTGRNVGLMNTIIHFMFRNKELLKKLPILGTILIRVKNKMLQNSTNVSSTNKILQLDQILGMYFEEFIVTAYKLILEREPDLTGLSELKMHAYRGASNEAIAYLLISSEEFNHRFDVANIRKYKKKYNSYRRKSVLCKIPIFGRMLRISMVPSQLTIMSNHMEYTNNQLKDAIMNNSNGSINRDNIESEKIESLYQSVKQLDAKMNSVDTIMNSVETKMNSMDTMMNLVDSKMNSVDTMMNSIETKMNSYDVNINLVNELTTSCFNKIDKYFEDINEKLSIQNNNQLTSLNIETSISEKIDLLPGFIAQNNLKNKTAITSLPGGVLAVQVGDLVMGIPSEEWGLAMFLSLNGHFEPGSEKVFSSLIKKDMTIIDVGANLGIYTLLALKAGCIVYSYEPTPSTFDLLNQNIKVNGFMESQRAHSYNLAVGDCEKTTTFSICKGISGHNHIAANDETDNVIEVPVVALDNHYKGGKVDFIKIDVEGAEYDAIIGMKNIIINNPQLKILMEFAPSQLQRAGVNPEDLLKLIRDYGLCIQKINEDLGQVEPVSDEELATEFSINLLLSHQMIRSI